METFSGVVFDDTLKLIMRQSSQSAFILASKLPGECDRTKIIYLLIFKNQMRNNYYITKKKKEKKRNSIPQVSWILLPLWVLVSENSKISYFCSVLVTY